MTPKIIKLASGETLYANQDLIKFIKQTLALPSGTMKTKDRVFFFKNVDFKRDMLYISEETFKRVIKLENADVVVVSTDLTFPSKALSLKNNKIDANCPLEEADDILYNISSSGQVFTETFLQWFKLSQLTTTPQIIFESELLNFVNSGFVIDESNYEAILQMLNTDQRMACKTIDNCKIAESLNYILYLIYFRKGLMNYDSNLIYNLPNINRYLGSKGCGATVSRELFTGLVQDEYFGPKITASVSETIDKVVQQSSNMNAMKHLIDSLDINFKWK